MSPEARIEKEIVEYCDARGFLCLKLALIGRRGFPDRTVLIPGLKPLFVEIKTPRGRPSKQQLLWLERLREFGFTAVITRSVKEFHAQVNLYVKDGGCAFEPHQYQQHVIDRLIDTLFVRDEKGLGLFLDPGLGKTAIVLRSLEMLKDLGERWKTLVVAPLRVAHSVWPVEVAKWEFDLDVVLVHGTPQRRRQRLSEDADLYVTTPDLIPWLRAEEPSFDLLVVDESTKFKSWSAKRGKALRKVLPPKRVILTGTPSPDSLADLHAQVYLLDDGAALGRTQSYFRAKWMYRGGYEGREWMMRPGVESQIHESVSSLVVRLDAVDFLDLPEVLYNDIFVRLPDDVATEYRRLQRDLVAELGNGAQLVASGAGGKYVMCRQLANGGLYERDDEGRVTHHIHQAKVDALEDLVEELSGKPLIVFYMFTHDRERLQARWPKAPAICGGMPTKKVGDLIDAWNRDEIKILLAQPQAMSHGLNLQYGSCEDIAWFGLPDSLETYQQANARVYRQGRRRRHLRIHHILAERTVDVAIKRRIDEKDTSQATLLDALREVPC